MSISLSSTSDILWVCFYLQSIWEYLSTRTRRYNDITVLLLQHHHYNGIGVWGGNMGRRESYPKFTLLTTSTSNVSKHDFKSWHEMYIICSCLIFSRNCPLLIQIQITTSLGHFFLRGVLGEIRMLPLSHLSLQWTSFLSANPLLCLGSLLHFGEGTMFHSALYPGSGTCVVEICGSSSPGWLPLDSFLLVYTAHSPMER